MLILVSPFWSSQIQRPDRYVVLRASASSLTVLEVSAGSHSAAMSSGSLEDSGHSEKEPKVEGGVKIRVAN